MLSARYQWAKRGFFWLVMGYALLATTCVPENLRSFSDKIFGPSEAQLVVVSETPILDITVTFDGQRIEAWPRWRPGFPPHYILFPKLRWQHIEPVLTVSWTTAHGTQSLTRTMEQADWVPACLYVLRLGPDGAPSDISMNGFSSPYWGICGHR